MKPPSTETKSETLEAQAEVGEKRWREENAKKAKEAAEELFPGEKWRKIEDEIYLSPNRAIGKKTNYADELKDAQILRDLGNTVYLVPESRREGKKYDALVNGLKFEFKNIGGNAEQSSEVSSFERGNEPVRFFV